MSVLYADTSALVRVYFVDEPDHDELQELLLKGRDIVVTSEIARLEMASAIYAAQRTGRLKKPRIVLDRFDADCAPEGPIILLALDPSSIFPSAVRLLMRSRLRTLDAIHLAVARDEEREAGGDLKFVSRDESQAAAARSLGLNVN